MERALGGAGRQWQSVGEFEGVRVTLWPLPSLLPFVVQPPTQDIAQPPHTHFETTGQKSSPRDGKTMAGREDSIQCVPPVPGRACDPAALAPDSRWW